MARQHRDYEERLIAEVTRLLDECDPADELRRHPFLDDFRLDRVYMEGSFPDAKLAVLFHRPGQSSCLYGARSVNVWAPQTPNDDWWPLDATESNATIPEVADMLRIRLDMYIWPPQAEPAPPCEPDAGGVTWMKHPWGSG